MIDVITHFGEVTLIWVGAITAITVALGTIWRKSISPIHRKVEKILAISEYEFTPNGGQSTADKLARLEENQVELKAHDEKISLELTTHNRVISERLTKIETKMGSIELLHSRVDELQEARIIKAEAREIPPEPSEAPAGSAILPRQIVSLEKEA